MDRKSRQRGQRQRYICGERERRIQVPLWILGPLNGKLWGERENGITYWKKGDNTKNEKKKN